MNWHSLAYRRSNLPAKILVDPYENFFRTKKKPSSNQVFNPSIKLWWKRIFVFSSFLSESLVSLFKTPQHHELHAAYSLDYKPLEAMNHNLLTFLSVSAAEQAPTYFWTDWLEQCHTYRKDPFLFPLQIFCLLSWLSLASCQPIKLIHQKAWQQLTEINVHFTI